MVEESKVVGPLYVVEESKVVGPLKVVEASYVVGALYVAAPWNTFACVTGGAGRSCGRGVGSSFLFFSSGGGGYKYTLDGCRHVLIVLGQG